ncbi:extracellular matrix/biofilm biosynthesis regulator RemA family protein [Alkaliphilus sp. B6464]|uniref:extracellular matrix/biofilm biosynthesis regulator RemA family protein n=1 Tax=Alkaliphilus sp. B6464 TaxID=2731219 RepID=UPI001BABE2F9|nr:extracellular matrix/biofilm biosynthesis regulator RemA family protein [Alkaliphilus sp. B6464]QUH22144.1 DUF370 domain-containing protein [Alkaliphilus sp. B6464]
MIGNSKFKALISIGFDYFIDKENIIAILNPNFLQTAESFPKYNEYIETQSDKKTRSLIYCKGGYLIASPIDSKTIKKRYQEFQDRINGISDDKNIYIKLT